MHYHYVDIRITAPAIYAGIACVVIKNCISHNFYRSVKDAVAQTSEILTYEADVQSIHRVDQEVNIHTNVSNLTAEDHTYNSI